MEVLKKTIAEGKTSIAILYGTGHMPDFDKRLVQELNMVPVTVEWYTAWSIKEVDPKANSFIPLVEYALTSL
ncbi:hypothetical protein FCM35_KLT17133 [Carex littledalei]|uniref:Uncharacterized protein n=1 Tax=Carex littledalei TaxID=544730 RepID=A0A833RFN6_9POAL|nr:hypothetical protein FCM35_KLT17133 [Carex littledalei]